MALIESNMLKLGKELPQFNLLDVISNKHLSNESLVKHKALLIMFICNHCPYVQYIWEEFSSLEHDFVSKGVKILAVNSNDVKNYPQDGPLHMKALHQKMGWGFPFLLDEDQSFAKALQAACTPDFYIYDQDSCLAYRGQLDDSRPGRETKVNGKDIRNALNNILSGHRPDTEQKPSVGCSIKWKPGNEPQSK